MAAEGTERPEGSVEKTIWGYMGKAVLWIALILSGLALERLGLTSDILSGALPGEVQTLRADIDETTQKVSLMKGERDTLRTQIGYIVEAPEQLEQCLGEIKRIEATLQSPPAAEAPPSPRR